MSASPRCPQCNLDLPPDTDRCPRDGTLITLEPTVRRDPLLGAQVGDYQVRGRLGEGGMGLVYEAYQAMIGKAVAIKILHPEFAANPIWMRRFVDEARSVNAIGHRGIVDIFGFGQLSDGRQYLVMELLAGEALDVVLDRRKTLVPAEVIPVLQEVSEALSAAHGVGIVHRDLKPSNIFMVKPLAGAPYVKLLDFGLAKQRARKDQSRATQKDVLVGTPEYMSPEQARSEEVSPQSDLYALGVIAFEMLTGRLPFDGGNPIATLNLHLTAKVPRLSDIDGGIPEALQTLIYKLLQKRPEDRPVSAGSVGADLQRIRRTLQLNSTRVGVSKSGEIARLKPGRPGKISPPTLDRSDEEGAGQDATLVGRSIADEDPTQSRAAEDEPPQEPALDQATLLRSTSSVNLSKFLEGAPPPEAPAPPGAITRRSMAAFNPLSVFQRHRNPLVALASALGVLVFGLTFALSHRSVDSFDDGLSSRPPATPTQGANPRPKVNLPPPPYPLLKRRLEQLEAKLVTSEREETPGARNAILHAREKVEAAATNDVAAGRIAVDALDQFEEKFLK